MRTLTRFCLVGLIATLVSPIPGVLAFHEPGHIPPTGTCREEHCLEKGPERDKDKDKDKTKDKNRKKKCDKSLMEEYER